MVLGGWAQEAGPGFRLDRAEALLRRLPDELQRKQGGRWRSGQPSRQGEVRLGAGGGDRAVRAQPLHAAGGNMAVPGV